MVWRLESDSLAEEITPRSQGSQSSQGHQWQDEGSPQHLAVQIWDSAGRDQVAGYPSTVLRGLSTQAHTHTRLPSVSAKGRQIKKHQGNTGRK